MEFQLPASLITVHPTDRNSFFISRSKSIKLPGWKYERAVEARDIRLGTSQYRHVEEMASADQISRSVNTQKIQDDVVKLWNVVIPHPASRGARHPQAVTISLSSDREEHRDLDMSLVVQLLQ
jgi:hypothetical protein